MADFNLVKVENNFEGNFFSFLNPKNWCKRKFTKDNANILFIDDLDMPVFENLKRAGYKVKKIRDVKNVDDADVQYAQIIFVDFDGVGKFVSPQHQGAGLAKEIKTKYLATKYVVLYTAQPTLPADTVMKELFNAVDARLRKDADVTDFTDQIREAFKKLK